MISIPISGGDEAVGEVRVDQPLIDELIQCFGSRLMLSPILNEDGTIREWVFQEDCA